MSKFRKFLLLGSVTVALVGSLVAIQIKAAFNDVTFDSDTTIAISGLGINLTLVSGGSVAGLTVNSGSVDFNLESGSSVEIRSTDKRLLSNSLTNTVCVAAGYSKVVLSSATTQTVTVTPGTANVCDSSGVSGLVSPNPLTPAPEPSPAPQPEAQPSAPTAPEEGKLILIGNTVFKIENGKRLGFPSAEVFLSHGYNFNQVVPATQADLGLPVGANVALKASAFSSDLRIGARGDTVVLLQTFLEGKGFLQIPIGISKGYFGPLTRLALSAYQQSVGLPATGFFGPQTRALINSAAQ